MCRRQSKIIFFHFRLKITVTDFKGIKTRNTFRENRYLEK
ncbi:replication protein [Clostridium botulinum]|nr:replication protein [Clostridium botulinum]MBO0530155.1 replication protein [Clostridium botulinum]MBO0531410.1 replication protein [Clostridium botulinum]MBO0534128.1 replication protein [Clostridium botulinum]MBO0538178.1 replication protein [Clostridium botulinum]